MVINLGQWISSLFTRIPPTKQDWISSLYLWEIEVFQQSLKLESYNLQCNHCISHMIHMIEIDSHDEPHNSARYAFIHCTVLGFQVFVAFSWELSWLATLLWWENASHESAQEMIIWNSSQTTCSLIQVQKVKGRYLTPECTKKAKIV